MSDVGPRMADLQANPMVGGFLRAAARTKAQRLNPFSWYREKLQGDPVQWDEVSRGWDVFGYAEAQAVLKDHAHFSSERFRAGVGMRPGQAQSILNLDPPRHTALRNLVNLAFTPKAVQYWGVRIKEIADELLADIDRNLSGAEGEIDLVATYAYPLPVIVIAEMMGIPSTDRSHFKRWSDVLVEGPSSVEPSALMELMLRKQSARQEMEKYFGEILQTQKDDSEYSLIGILREANIDGQKLSVEEIISFCILLLAAGNETTTNLITNTWRCLLQHPQAVAAVEEDRGLLPGLVEETLRFYSPVQATSRIALEDVELFSRRVASGDRVTVWIGAANRDERVFAAPDEFDVRRAQNHHLAFGHGIHFCLGAPLARMEADIAIGSMLARYQSFAAAWTELDPIVSGFVFGVKSLPMRLAPR
ncbi:MAG: cytochrome P450 [Firmicutes bacterium]|nr:cytochrome P450 [Bacillota bacterium]